MARHERVAGGLVAGGFLAVAGALVAWGRIPARVAYDQLLYHETAIRIFAKQWPAVDVSDYLSATTPGYHLLMAGLSHGMGLGTAGMQCVGAVITGALLWVLARGAAEMGGIGWRGVAAVCAPFAASMYVVASGVWLLPDNAAWLGVLVMLLLALRKEQSAASLALGGMVLTVLVFTRQIHAWTGGLLVAGAWLSAGPPEVGHRAPGPWVMGRDARGLLFTDFGKRCMAGAAAVLACLPAALVMVYFYGLWGGVVPPTFQMQYHHANAAGPAFLLAVFGLMSVPFAGYLWAGMRRLVREHVGWAGLAAMAGGVLAVVPRTTAGSVEDYTAGRRTGLWSAVKLLHEKLHVPYLGGHTSVFVVVLAVIGAVALAGWVMGVSARRRVVFVAAMMGYGMALAASTELWQRYAEPFVLMMLALLAGAGAGRAWRWSWVGPVVLAGVLGVQTASGLLAKDSQGVHDPAPPAETQGATGKPPRPDSPWSNYQIHHQSHPSVGPTR